MNPSQPVPRHGPLNALTGLRFFAAVAVVVFHYCTPDLMHVPRFLQYIVLGGANGVTLFFILSGFVLAYNYADPAKTDSFNKADFWKARFARIYPVYLLSLLLTLNEFTGYVHGLLHQFSRANVFRALTSFAMVLTLTQAWNRTRGAIWNYPGWTLSVELLFYATFPWACYLVGKLKPATLLPAVCALIIFGAVARGICLAVSPGKFGAWATTVWPPMRLPEFLIGLVLGRLYMVRPGARIRHRNAVSILTATAIFTVLASPVPQRAVFVPALLQPLFALLIYALASGPGIMAGFLSLPSMVLLGNASYAIYILQVPVMETGFRILGSNGLAFCTGLLALTGISIAVFLYFETPARKWIRKRWAHRSETPLAVPAAG